MGRLKFNGYTIAFQEVPDETALVINISGCPHRCNGCHSEYLWENSGLYIDDELETLLDRYAELITCVCFMGGDQDLEDLYGLLRQVRKRGLKTALYSGLDDISALEEVLPTLNYVKIGHYAAELGGLDAEHTNQRMYKLQDGKRTDITHRFQKRRLV